MKMEETDVRKLIIPISVRRSWLLRDLSFPRCRNSSWLHRICLVHWRGVGVVTIRLVPLPEFGYTNIDLLTGKPGWTEYSFTCFLAYILPIANPWRLDSAPMMYRLFRQLGSYPYQTQPTSDTLSFDQMAMAIQILIRRFWYYKVHHDEDMNLLSHSPMKDKRFCKLLFQSLTASGTQSEPVPRLYPDNDIDLIHIRRMLCMFSAHGGPSSNGEMIYGAGVREYKHFPSSFSNDFSGRLLESELTVLFRLLVANKREKPENHDVGAEADGIVTYLVETEFRKQKSLSDGKIGWKAFSQVLDLEDNNLMVGIHYFLSLSR